MLLVIAVGFAGCVVAYFGMDWVYVWVTRRQLLDVPGERSSHTVPTPRGGGLTIVCVTLGGSLAYGVLNANNSVPWWGLAAYVLGATLIAVVSWLDDLRSLPNRVRFAAHTVAAVVVLLTLGYWQALTVPAVGTIHLGWLGLPVTFLWIVGLTNAYNFMDGIDGLAAGQAVVAGVGWCMLGVWTGEMLVATVGILIAVSSLAFLRYNWPPARIFMGDVGSAFLGFTLAVLPLFATTGDSVLPVVGLGAVWPFVFDAVFTFVRRCVRRENVFSAHRSHLYQRLVISGMSHRQVTSLYVGLACLGLVWLVPLVQRWRTAGLAVTAIIVLAGLGLWVLVQWRERRISQLGRTTEAG